MYVGIDIGGTNLVAAVIGKAGQIISTIDITNNWQRPQRRPQRPPLTMKDYARCSRQTSSRSMRNTPVRSAASSGTAS